MPKFLIKANYVGEGITGLQKEGGTGRVKAVQQLCESVGATLEGAWYAFGEYDFYCVIDAPDTESVAAVSLITNGTGRVTVETVPLISPEQMDAAAKLTPAYRAPGT
jgi:uncharacterized protein with GYD domain